MNTLVALCAVGAEKILGNEIKRLGCKLVGNAPGRVIFEGDDDSLFRANLCLRAADRVYLQMANFSARDFDDLFDGVYGVEWQDFFRKDTRVVIDKVRIYKSALSSESAMQGIAQKAVYKKLGDKWGMTTFPESGEERDIRVYVSGESVMVLLDLSGEPLRKRGWRSDGGQAPMRETMAATLLQEMLWRRKKPLHDPFCGSGTIAIEAALYAHDAPPGAGRSFALETLPFFDSSRALQIRNEALSKIRLDVETRVAGSDIDAEAVSRAKKNAERAFSSVESALRSIGIDARVERPEFIQSDFADLRARYDSGLVLCNPPYGIRLGDEAQADALYQKMGRLWENFPGWEFGVITSRKTFQKNFGHYADALKSFKAGNLAATLYIYQDTGVRGGKSRG